MLAGEANVCLWGVNQTCHAPPARSESDDSLISLRTSRAGPATITSEAEVPPTSWVEARATTTYMVKATIALIGGLGRYARRRHRFQHRRPQRHHQGIVVQLDHSVSQQPLWKQAQATGTEIGTDTLTSILKVLGVPRR